MEGDKIGRADFLGGFYSSGKRHEVQSLREDVQWLTTSVFQFYQLPETAEDVFTLWSPNDLHKITLNNPDNRPPPGTQTAPKKNLETLIYACIARLSALQHGHCYADPHKPIAPEVLNCIRILTRLLPYIYEADHLRDWEDNFLWKPRKAQQIWDKKNNRPGEYFDGLNPTKRYPKEDYDDEVGEREIGPPLGEELINILVRYMFFPGFTVPKKLDAQGLPDLKVQYHIWNSGIGCRQSVGMTRENERHAVEVIRLLLSLCSRELYIQPRESPSLPQHSKLPERAVTTLIGRMKSAAHCHNWRSIGAVTVSAYSRILTLINLDIVADTNVRPLFYMTSQPDRQVTLSMICSLLNTVRTPSFERWRVTIEESEGTEFRGAKYASCNAKQMAHVQARVCTTE